VRREAANRATLYCWYQRRCGAVGVHLGECRHIIWVWWVWGQQFYADGRVRTVRPGLGNKLTAVPPPPHMLTAPAPPHHPARPVQPLVFYAENQVMTKQGNHLWQLAVGENSLEVRTLTGSRVLRDPREVDDGATRRVVYPAGRVRDMGAI
jgi:hypothetical protein